MLIQRYIVSLAAGDYAAFPNFLIQYPNGITIHRIHVYMDDKVNYNFMVKWEKMNKETISLMTGWFQAVGRSADYMGQPLTVQNNQLFGVAIVKLRKTSTVGIEIEYEVGIG